MLYRLAFELLLSRLEPERAHALAATGMRALHASAAGRALLRTALTAPPPQLAVHAMGLRFASPLGVAAGLDKDATWFGALGALGFGSVEVGTLTASAQAGNPRPRIARVAAQRALVNRMGFPNGGAAAAAGRLAERRRTAAGIVVGVNIGRSRTAGPEHEREDYRQAARVLAPVADYLALNVSSPNTPGLRELQAHERLRSLVGAVQEELAALAHRPPLLVKLSPDLSDHELAHLGELALELELDGLIAVNTTTERSLLGAAAQTLPFEGGGVSGAPLRARALRALEILRAVVGRGLTLISVGGIMDGADARERLDAGATLVQAYTGLVYGGPAWAARVNRELAVSREPMRARRDPRGARA
jgi:dihydroorotate dehydrogenase